ncbi:hypothetical protein OG709_30000 [Streptomyces sp. NBC_01267]|uniref:hypothetical protein n=1 Tax=Streptomyces sp. NBC_01267 TaxID=2903805 RepID=UPI002E3492D3|nr:hypothetical protein [Streptomyces sp. NBC_01267]
MFGKQEPTYSEQREALAQLLMDNQDVNITPVFDAADGMRADLLARGWSAEIAEYLAAAWLSAMLAKMGAA